MACVQANILLRHNSRRVARQREPELKFRRSIELPPHAQSSSDDRGDGDVRSLREPSPAKTAEGAAGEGVTEATPPPPPRRAKRGRTASIQKIVLHLMKYLLVRIIQANFFCPFWLHFVSRAVLSIARSLPY